MTDYLNKTVWLKLAPSPIDGIGVFAIRDIPKGQRLYCKGMTRANVLKLNSFDGVDEEIRHLISQRWPLALKGDVFQHPHSEVRLLSFMNHSLDPNYEKLSDRAMRDIKKGEEITEDYGAEVNF